MSGCGLGVWFEQPNDAHKALWLGVVWVCVLYSQVKPHEAPQGLLVLVSLEAHGARGLGVAWVHGWCGHSQNQNQKSINCGQEFSYSISFAFSIQN